MFLGGLKEYTLLVIFLVCKGRRGGGAREKKVLGGDLVVLFPGITAEVLLGQIIPFFQSCGDKAIMLLLRQGSL